MVQAPVQKEPSSEPETKIEIFSRGGDFTNSHKLATLIKVKHKCTFELH
jgi:hypothetical protein